MEAIRLLWKICMAYGCYVLDLHFNELQRSDLIQLRKAAVLQKMNSNHLELAVCV